MKIKDGFMTRNIGGKIVAVAVGTRALEFNGIINLNKTAEFIWKCLEQDTTKEDIVNKVMAEYEINHETAEDAVTKFIDELEKNELLEK